jgi:hypothetical protein
MKAKAFTKEGLDPLWGETVLVGTKENEYEGEVIDVTAKHLVLEYFNLVKDEVRELDIPFADILWVKEIL